MSALIICVASTETLQLVMTHLGQSYQSDLQIFTIALCQIKTSAKISALFKTENDSGKKIRNLGVARAVLFFQARKAQTHVPRTH